MKEIRAMILRVGGTNCDVETAHAFELAGAHSDIVHINELHRGKKSLEDYHILAIPGGFSYGDDISAAIIWANELRYKLANDVKKFVDEGKPVIGICNGFQVLVKAGLLPAFEEPLKKQEATLACNDIGMYHDRWVHLKLEADGCLFTKNINKNLFLPVAHGEGKFMIGESGLKKLEDKNLIVFRYVDNHGNIAGFPWNPNGALANIAAIRNEAGNVLGMMPHPERHLHKYMHPHWTKMPWLREEGDGLIIFKNAVEYIRKKV
jgi:phosphoribosylformylglycinamidine synthase